MLQSPKAPVRENLRTGVSERSSCWCQLHNGKAYLLPIVSRELRYVPEFKDGKVELKIEHFNPEFADRVNEVILLAAAFHAGKGPGDNGTVFLVPAQCEKFILLVRELILRNYDFTDEEIVDLLSLNNRQWGILFSNVYEHLLRQ